ncbi:MAG: HDOD domain-containing protein [Spirochaetales bacterium]|nr:HDOD domain-containing protein [Spirochaetales bacterium]
MADLTIKDPSVRIREVLAGEPLVLNRGTFLDKSQQELGGFLGRLLAELGIGFLTEMVLVLLKEALTNAARGFAKRLYFQEKGLNLAQDVDYQRGIRGFRDEAIENWDDWLLAHPEMMKAVRFTLRLEEDLEFEIQSDYEILPPEWERISTRIKSFNPAVSFESAMEQNSDEQEGAGLGILLCLTLMHNAGLDPGSFRIESSKGQSTTFFRIPRSVVTPQLRKTFLERVAHEVRDIPSFPDFIANLIKLCDSEQASVQRIASEIQRDPALTSSVLKLVHSAGYMNRIRNPTLTDAVKVIGLKTVKNLLMVTGVTNVINARYRIRELEQIWERSHRVSFFARQLAAGKAQLSDVVTIAGLLHYLGKIVLLSLDERQVKIIQELYDRRSVRSATALEENMLGIAHPEIGGQLMERWRFPATLTESVRYQSRPLHAPPEYRDAVYHVYLATRIEESLSNKKGFIFLEQEVLQAFAIETESQFQALTQKLKALYQSS